MTKRDDSLSDPYAPTGDEPAPAAVGRRGSAPELPPAASPLYRAEPPRPPARLGSLPDLATDAPLRDPEAPPSRVIEPPPPTLPAKRRRRRGLALLVGTAIAGVVVGGGLLARQLLSEREAAPMFPERKLAALPESTVLVRRVDRARVGALDFPFAEPNDRAVWSFLGQHLCGGTDVFRHLMNGKVEASRGVVVASLDVRHSTAQALTCGKELSASLGATHYDIQLEGERDLVPEPYSRPRRVYKDDEPPKEEKTEKPPIFRVTLLDLGKRERPERLPKSFVERPDRAGLLATRCSTELFRRFAECSVGSLASARLEGAPYFVTGRVGEIEAFGREFSPQQKNQLEEATAFEALAQEVAKFEHAEIGKFRAFDVSFVRRIGCGAPFTSWDTTAFNVKLSEAVTKFKASWAIGDSVGQEGGEMRVLFMPETEGEAIDLVLDLKDWHAAANEFFEKLEEPDMGGQEEVKATERDYRKAIHTSGVRALKDATVERSGKLVSLVIQAKIESDERDAIKDMKREIDDLAKAAAKAIDQIMSGERPDDDLLQELGGKELVDAVKHKNQPLKREF